MKHDSSKKFEYTVGLILMAMYIFTSYVAVDVTISSSVNTIFLYAFLAWGTLVVLMHGRLQKLPIHTIYYACFMAVSLVSMGYSPEFSVLSGQFYLMIVAFFLTFLFQQFIKKDKDFRRMCWFFALASLALVVMLQFTGNLVGSSEDRLGQEIMGNANKFAIMIMVAVLYELWLLVYGTKKWYVKIILVVMTIYNMYALALSAGRKYVVIPFVFLYILLMYKTNKKGKRNVVLYTLILVILIIVAYNVMMKNEVLYDSIGYRMEQLIEGQEDEGKLDGSLKIREIMRNDAIEQWWENPLWGYGFDSYKYRANIVVKHFYYSHCNYAEMLYNGGIVMFVAYYWIYFKIISDFFKKKKASRKFRAFTIGTVISVLIFDYADVTYSMFIIQLLLAMSLKCLDFVNEDTLEEERIEKID